MLPDPLPFSHWRPISLGGGATLPPRTLWVLGAGLAIAAAAGYLLTRTRFGVAVSAVTSEPLGAQIVGLPVDRLVTAMGACGQRAFVQLAITPAPVLFERIARDAFKRREAALVGTSGGAVTTETGLSLGLKAIAAALLAGLGSPGRVFRAALLLGVFESAVVGLHVPGLPRLALGPAWRDVAPLLLALAVIAFRALGAMREPVE